MSAGSRSISAPLALVVALVGVLLLIGAPRAEAAVCDGLDTFTGQAGNEDWGAAANWSAGVPSRVGQTAACIPAGFTVRIVRHADSSQYDNSQGGAGSLTIASGATLQVDGIVINTSNFQGLLDVNSLDNAGTIRLDGTGAGNNGQISIEGSGTCGGFLTNEATGSILSNSPVLNQPNTICGILNNHGSVETVTGALQFLMPGVNTGPMSTAHSDGTITTDAGTVLYLTNRSGQQSHYSIDGGTVTNNGTLQIDQDMLATGGTIGGANPVTLLHNAALGASGTGTGSFTMASGAGINLSADIGPGYTLSMPGGGVINNPSHFTNKGTLSLTATAAHSADILGSFTNQGTFTLSFTGGTGPVIHDTLTNQGTLEAVSGTPLSNNPVIQAAGTLKVDNGAVFSPNSLTVQGGQIVNNGSLTPANDVTVTGGQATGNPPEVATGKTISLTGNGSGVYEIGQGFLNNDIAAGYTLIVDGLLQLKSNVVNHGTFEVRGDGGNPDIRNFAIDNQGTLRVDPSGATSRTFFTPLQNEGTMDVGADLTLQQALTNTGTIGLSGGATLTLPSFTQTAGTTTLTGPADTLNATGDTATLSGGTLAGAGKVKANLTSTGTVAPTPGAQPLTVTGNYTQSAGGFLSTRVTGAGVGTLHVTGTAALGGTLQVSTASDFVPPEGSVYDAVTAGTVNGTFPTTAGLDSGPYTLDYSATKVTLTAQGRPNPTSLLSIGDATVARPVGGSATARFALTLSAPAAAPVTVHYATANGTASTPDDYAATSGTATIPAGQTTATVDVTLFPSDRPGTRTFFLDLSAPSGADLANARGTGTILGHLGLDGSSPAQAGNTGSVTLTITGTGLSSADSVKLTAPGKADIHGTAVAASSDGHTLTARVNLAGAPLGARDVVVTSGTGGGEQRLVGALTVAAATPPIIEAGVGGPTATRPFGGWFGHLYLHNLGNTEAVHTFVRIDGLPSGVHLDVTGSEGPASMSDDGSETAAYVLVPRVGPGAYVSLPISFVYNNRLVAHQIVASPAVMVMNDSDPDAISDPSARSTITRRGTTSDGHYHLDVHGTNAGGTIDSSLDAHLTTAPSGATLPQIEIEHSGGTTRVHALIPLPQNGCYIPGDATAGVLSWNCAKQQQFDCQIFHDSFVGADCSAAFQRPARARGGAHAASVVHVIEYSEVFAHAIHTIAEGKHVATTTAEETVERHKLNDCYHRLGLLPESDLAELNTAADAEPAWEWTKVLQGGATLPFGTAAGVTEFATNQLLAGLVDGFYGKKLAEALAAQSVGGNLTNGRPSPLHDLALQYQQATGEDRDYIRRQLINRAELECIRLEAWENHERSHDPIRELLSHDPNEVSGPAGPGSRHYLNGVGRPYTYTVTFENKSTAGAPAAQVVVRDQVDRTRLDLASLSLGPVSFGKQTITPPAGSQTFRQRVDLRPAKNLLVDVAGSLNRQTGMITWVFRSIDPATNRLVSDANAGFLPPDRRPPEGQGSVSFSARPTAAGLRDRARTTDAASIVFDTNAAIATNTWANVIDRTAPTSRVTSVRARVVKTRVKRKIRRSHRLLVAWRGSDRAAGVAGYDVSMATGGGRFRLIALRSTRRTTTIVCRPGRNYRFSVKATDRVGNAQKKPARSRSVRCR